MSYKKYTNSLKNAYLKFTWKILKSKICKNCMKDYKIGCKHVKNTRKMQDAQITKQIEECQVVVWQPYQREYQWKPTFKQR